MNFSVLMSIYHKENPAFLNQCFISIWIEQTAKPSQIVLVKDGILTPELEQVILVWQEKLSDVLKIVPLDKNVGLGKALNIGLEHCIYDWVFRMDTDDICVPERFEKQVEFILKHPQTTIFGGQIAEFGEGIDDIVSYRSVPTAPLEIKHFALKRCPFNHMTVAYQKNAVLACGGYEDLQEDYYLWLKLIAQDPQVANLPDMLVYARVGNGMVSRRRGWAQAKAEWRLFRLKTRLRLQGEVGGFITFMMRMLPRLLPVSLLSGVYKWLRK